MKNSRFRSGMPSCSSTEIGLSVPFPGNWERSCQPPEVDWEHSARVGEQRPEIAFASYRPAVVDGT